MDGKKVAIKYQYFRLCTIDGDDTTDFSFDLRPWINRLVDMKLENRIKEISDISGRLENLRFSGAS